MFEQSLQQILERWKKAFGQYNELKAAAEPAVVRWEWTTGQRYSPLPFYFNRFPGRARTLKGPPTEVGYYIRYGFDEQNRLRLHRFYGYLDLDGQERLQRHRIYGVQAEDAIGETFYNYHDTLAETIEFSVPPRIPLKIHQIFYQNDQVVRHVSFELNGYSPLYSEKGKDPDELYEWLGYNGCFKTVEQYLYEGNRLTTIASYHEVPGISPFYFQERFIYDEVGKLGRIEGFREDGSKQIVYQRRKKGQTFQSIRETATQKMIEAVIEKLRAANIRDKLYCIELSYQAVRHHFPPSIIPGLESYRQSLLNSSTPDAQYCVFAPVLQGKEWFWEITDPDTLEICQLLEQEIQTSEKWNTATRILRDVAAALTHYDWTNILDVTSDFVVFAIDHEMEGDHLDRVLSASAPKELIQEWKKKGWL